MSYDVGIGAASFNVTYNVSKLFYDHIPDMGKGGGLHELHGVTGKQAVEIIADAFERLNRTRHSLWSEYAIGEPRFCKLYDAPNGWGSAIGAILFLANLQGACARNPRKKVGVY